MKIVAFDLETTNLTAIMGRVLCGSFLNIVDGVKTKPRTLRLDQLAKKDRMDDRKLVCAIRDELENAHMIVGWNSKMFDVPFLNARLVFHGERIYKPQMHLDLMYYSKGTSARIGSSKLLNSQKFFRLKEAKTDISWENWNRAALGERPAMDDVVLHCEKDVVVLAEVYWRLLPFVANIHR